MEVKEISSEQFDQYLKKSNLGSIYQSVEYADAMKQEKFEPIYYGFELDGELIGATLILVQKLNGFKYAYAPNGYLLDYSDTSLIKTVTDLLNKQLKKKRIMAIKLSPLVIKSKYNTKKNDVDDDPDYNKIFEEFKNNGYYHFGNNNYFESLTPRFESIIQINKSVGELFKSLSKNYRSKVKKANFQGIKIYKGNSNYIDFIYNNAKSKYQKDLNYYKNLYENFKNSNKADIYFAKLDTKIYLQSVQVLYQKQVEKCNVANSLVFKNREKENNKAINRKLYEENILNKLKNELVYATGLLKSHPEGIDLAAALVIRQNKSVYLLMDGYDKEYKQFSAKHLLMWKLLEKYSLEKFKKFNMGAIANYNLKDSDNNYKGLNEFRLDFGATGYEYIGDFEIITSKFLYFMYQTLSPILKKSKKGKNQNKLENNESKDNSKTNEETKKTSLIEAIKILLHKKD